MEQENCLRCQKRYDMNKGVYCMKTTPYYSLEECNHTVEHLIGLATEYDSRAAPDDKILYSIVYNDPLHKPNREELCSILAEKLRTGPPMARHFFCDDCLNTLMLNLGDFRKINCFCNVYGGICDSYYDISYLMEHVERFNRENLLSPIKSGMLPTDLDFSKGDTTRANQLIELALPVPLREAEQCMYCQEYFHVSDGVFCVNTGPFLKNCLSEVDMMFIAKRLGIYKGTPNFNIYNDTYNSSNYICSQLKETIIPRPLELQLSPLSQEELVILNRQFGDEFDVRDEAGVENLILKINKQRHFFCSGKNTNQCINGLVKDMLTTMPFDGRLKCCANFVAGNQKQPCHSFFDIPNVIGHLNRPNRVLLQKAIRDLLLDVASKKINHYEECSSLVVPSCPNCKNVFFGWSACYALSCSNCKQGFCAVCLAYHGDTSRDTHTHILTACKKHEEWNPVNPQCNYFGSPPYNTSYLYIKVHTNQNDWVSLRRKRYPDEFVNAPTLFEKVYGYLEKLPPDQIRNTMDRIQEDNLFSLRGGREHAIRIYNVNTGMMESPMKKLDTLVQPEIYYELIRLNKNTTTLFGMEQGNFPLNLFNFIPIFYLEELFMKPFAPIQFLNERGILYNFTMNGDFKYGDGPDFVGHFEELCISKLDQFLDKHNDFYQFPFHHLTAHSHAEILFYLIRKSLIQHQAVLSGGFVLTSVSTKPIQEKKRVAELQDWDIYVNVKHAKGLLFNLMSLGFNVQMGHLTPCYDDSFMRKNKIKSRIQLKKETFEIDVMMIHDDVDITSVVTNFDLTFCQVWFDGKNISSNQWPDILSSSGRLNPEYVPSYQSGNRFIHKRIKKYTERGYRIVLPRVSREVLDNLEEYEQLSEKYRQLYADMQDNEDDEEINEIEDKIAQNTGEIRRNMAENKIRNPIQVSNGREWFINKLIRGILHMISVSKIQTSKTLYKVLLIYVCETYQNSFSYIYKLLDKTEIKSLIEKPLLLKPNVTLLEYLILYSFEQQYSQFEWFKNIMNSSGNTPLHSTYLGYIRMGIIEFLNLPSTLLEHRLSEIDEFGEYKNFGKYKKSNKNKYRRSCKKQNKTKRRSCKKK